MKPGRASARKAVPAGEAGNPTGAVPGSSRGKRGLTEHEWNFERLTELSELQACFLYELARESPRVRQLVTRWRRDNPLGSKKRETRDKFHREVIEAIPLAHFAWNLWSWNELIFLWTKWKKPPAWLELTEASRQHLTIRLVGKSAVDSGSFIDFVRIRDALTRKQKAAGHHPLTEASVMGEDGIERVVLAINWCDFDEKAIADAFARWLNGRRPKQWPPLNRTRRGAGGPTNRKWLLDVLNSLGIARLGAKFAPRELFEVWPDAWRHVIAKSDRVTKSKFDANDFGSLRRAAMERISRARATLDAAFAGSFPNHQAPLCLGKNRARRKG